MVNVGLADVAGDARRVSVRRIKDEQIPLAVAGFDADDGHGVACA